MDSADKCQAHITGDKQRILSCIQYEVVQKKTVFEVYENVCKTLGPDVMNFKELDFWYHQFANGIFDMDQEWSSATSALTLSGMPLEVLSRNIFGMLEMKDRLSLRKVSRGLRAQIDQMPTKDFNEVIFDVVDYDRVTLHINEDVFDYSTDDYEPDENDKMKGIKISGGFQKAYAKLIEVISAPGVMIWNLHIYIVAIRTVEQLKEILRTVNAAFEQLKKRIPVRRLTMTAPLESQMIAFMQFLEPGTLEHIDIFLNGFLPEEEESDEHVEELTKMDQWKEAKEVELDRLSCPLETLLHFNRFTAWSSEMDYGALLSIKNAFLSSPNIEYGCMKYEDDIDEVTLRKIFGWDKVFNPVTGKTFFMEYGPDEVIFKSVPLFEELTLIVHGTDSAKLKVDELEVTYGSDVENESDLERIGNWKSAIDHMCEMLQNPKLEITQLKVEFHELRNHSKKVLKGIEKMLKSIGRQLCVKIFIMSIDKEDELMAVLPYIESETIFRITVHGNKDHGDLIRLNKATETQQWKWAPNLRTWFVKFPLEGVRNSSHWDGRYNEMNEEELVAIRNMIIQEYSLCSVHLVFQNEFDVEKVRSLLSPLREEIGEHNDWDSSTLTVEVNPGYIRLEVVDSTDEIGYESDDS